MTFFMTWHVKTMEMLSQKFNIAFIVLQFALLFFEFNCLVSSLVTPGI